MLFVGLLAADFLFPQNLVLLTNDTPEHLPDKNSTNTTDLKLYRNEEWGFEFQYPKDWEVHENIFKSATSVFNLNVVPSEEKYLPDPILINIVTPEFASNSFSDLENIATGVVVGGVVGKKYEYEFETMQRVSIIIPFGEYKMILGTEKRYKDAFNEVYTTFKFE